MKTFLHQFNLSGKTVIPFNTNAGYDKGSSFDTVKELCPNSKLLEGYVTKGGEEREGKLLVIKEQRALHEETEVKKWLHKSKVVINN